MWGRISYVGRVREIMDIPIEMQKLGYRDPDENRLEWVKDNWLQGLITTGHVFVVLGVLAIIGLWVYVIAIQGEPSKPKVYRDADYYEKAMRDLHPEICPRSVESNTVTDMVMFSQNASGIFTPVIRERIIGNLFVCGDFRGFKRVDGSVGNFFIEQNDKLVFSRVS